jgi:hypothetical protein
MRRLIHPLADAMALWRSRQVKVNVKSAFQLLRSQAQGCFTDIEVVLTVPKSANRNWAAASWPR